jgi:hypothetical protein
VTTIMERLLSVPPAIATHLSPRSVRRADEAADVADSADWFAASDPAGANLGSGGGTAHLLIEGWRVGGDGLPFTAWLRRSRKLLVHGGGQSRRLPAYAAVGKPFVPMPALRWAWGQRLDQTLLDLQTPVYERVLAEAPPVLWRW